MLARHSDIRLTLGVYTHVGVHDQTAAIKSLPGPPASGEDGERESGELRVRRENGNEEKNTAA